MQFQTNDVGAVWVVQTGPFGRDLSEFFESAEEGALGEWRVQETPQEIAFGDLALLWHAGEDAELERGLYAVGRVVGSKFQPPAAHFSGSAVPVQYEVLLEQPVTLPDLRQADVVSEMETLTQTRGSTFQLRRADWEELREAFPRLVPEVDRELERTVIPPIRRREFAELLEECFDSYGWREHVEQFEEAREQGRRNWEEVRAKRRAGVPPVDAVLERLLPYKNTASAREDDRWTHPAPIVSTDVRKMYENAGWVEPEDWEDVVRSLVEFVEDCVESPGALEETCRAFADSPYSTGFQAATLTPILNAVEPDEFAIHNQKVVDTIEYFTGLETDTKLRNYPVANEVIGRVVDELGGVLDPAQHPGEVRRDDVFEVFAHWLVAVSEVDLSGTEGEYWKISPGRGAKYWNEWRDRSIASVGWNELGDLREMDRNEFESERDALIERREDYTESALNQVWKFSRVEPGDLLVANDGVSTVVGLGRVTGEYFYVDEEDDHPHRHRLPVDWFDTRRRRVDRPGWRRTLIKLDEGEYADIRDAELVDEGLAEASEIEVVEEPVEPTVRIEDAKNVVIAGPPGTGKTYVTTRRAVELGLRPDARLDREAVESEYRRLRRQGRIEFVTFHEAYDYEQFVEGLRPGRQGSNPADAPGEQRRADARDGIFKRLALRAASAGLEASDGEFESGEDEEPGPEQVRELLAQGRDDDAYFDFEDADDFVLIIDELHRGNVSQIFGELVTLLEPSKRLTEKDELTVTLPYSGEPFGVPPNLHILGTVNAADRSRALTDSVVRRRFEFEERMPDEQVLVDRLAERVPENLEGGREEFINLVVALFRNINGRLRLLRDENHQLGQTYYLDVTGWESLRKVFLRSIIPLLREYFDRSWQQVCLAVGCPYRDDGTARREDEEIRDGRKYAAPMISAWVLPERRLLGLDHEETVNSLDFEVTPEFEDGRLGADELREYFEGVLTGEHRQAYRNHEFFEDAP